MDEDDLRRLQGAAVENMQAKRNRREIQRLPLLIFADNFWLLAQSPRQLQSMATQWFMLLDRAGFSVELDDCIWTATKTTRACHTTPAPTVQVPNLWPRLRAGPGDDAMVKIPWREPEVPTKILGSYITMTNDATAEIEYRISRAWCTFNLYRGLLMARAIPYAKRVSALHRTVLRTLLYGIGTLNLTQRHLARLRATENHMMRIMLRIRSKAPAPEGLWDLSPAEEYMTNTNSLLNRLRQQHGWQRWDVKALQEVHSWAGHVARFRVYAPQRWAFQALSVKGLQYLRALERATGSQCHPKRFRVWRWEQQFSRYYGDNWMEQTLDQEAWADSRAAWLIDRQQWTKK